jgi:hypothetical protein
MIQETDNNKPKASAFSKFTVLTAVIIALVAALMIVSLFVYINNVRSSEMLSGDNLLTQNFLGSPLLVLDVLYIGVSLVFIGMIFFIIFRWEKNRNADSRNIYVDPVSSEIIEEKDLFINKTKLEIDTTQKSEFLDGENRFRGRGFYGNSNRDKFDSDGNRE